MRAGIGDEYGARLRPLQVIRVEEGDLHGTLKVSRVAETAPRDSAGRSSGSGLAGVFVPGGRRVELAYEAKGYEWAFDAGGRVWSTG